MEKESSFDVSKLYDRRILEEHIYDSGSLNSRWTSYPSYTTIDSAGTTVWKPYVPSSYGEIYVDGIYEDGIYEDGIYEDSEDNIPPDVKILKEEFREELSDRVGTKYRVVCKNAIDFDPKRILKNLSIMKSNLMMACAPIHVENIECKMTPKVKENLIIAYRKNKMFGKGLPIVPRFDEYMNRLPDKINITTLKGMNIEVVDPNYYGEFYLEFKAVVLKNKA